MGRIRWLKERGKPLRVEKLANAVMLFSAIVLVFLPIPLSVKNLDVLQIDTTPKNANYRVVIPYSDESISRHIGGSRWAGRTLCEINNVQAVDRDKAVEEALSVFKTKRREIPLYQFQKLTMKVVIIKESITVEKFKE